MKKWGNKIVEIFAPSLHNLWNIKQRTLSLLGGKTVGARALVIKDEAVLLVRHTYSEGWCTIGGAVDRGESPLQTIKREVFEETGIIIQEQPTLMGAYYSNFYKRDDYVLFYVIKKFDMVEVSSSEIAEKKWFNLSQLPQDITPATQRRIEEYLGLREISDRW